MESFHCFIILMRVLVDEIGDEQLNLNYGE